MLHIDTDVAERIQHELDRLGVHSKALWNERVHASYLGCSVSTCQKERHLGKGPPYLKIGHLARYHPEDVIRFCLERRISPATT